MLEDVRSTNKDVYNLGALIVSIESSLYDENGKKFNVLALYKYDVETNMRHNMY